MEDASEAPYTDLESCTYRYLQQLAKSMKLPCNVKKGHLIQMIKAKKFQSPEQLNAIVSRIKEERKSIVKPRRTNSRRKRKVQGTEISSTSHSPDICSTPVVPMKYKQTHHIKTCNITAPGIIKKIESDRVLRSFNRLRKNSKYFMNIKDTIIYSTRSTITQESRYDWKVNFHGSTRNEYGVKEFDKLPQLKQSTKLAEIDNSQAQVALVSARNANTPVNESCISGIYPLNPDASNYQQYSPTVNFKRLDPRIYKSSVLCTLNKPKTILKNKTTQTVGHNYSQKSVMMCVKENTMRPKLIQQDLVNRQIDGILKQTQSVDSSTNLWNFNNQLSVSEPKINLDRQKQCNTTETFQDNYESFRGRNRNDSLLVEKPNDSYYIKVTKTNIIRPTKNKARIIYNKMFSTENLFKKTNLKCIDKANVIINANSFKYVENDNVSKDNGKPLDLKTYSAKKYNSTNVKSLETETYSVKDNITTNIQPYDLKKYSAIVNSSTDNEFNTEPVVIDVDNSHSEKQTDNGNAILNLDTGSINYENEEISTTSVVVNQNFSKCRNEIIMAPLIEVYSENQTEVYEPSTALSDMLAEPNDSTVEPSDKFTTVEDNVTEQNYKLTENIGNITNVNTNSAVIASKENVIELNEKMPNSEITDNKEIIIETNRDITKTSEILNESSGNYIDSSGNLLDSSGNLVESSGSSVDSSGNGTESDKNSTTLNANGSDTDERITISSDSINELKEILTEPDGNLADLEGIFTSSNGSFVDSNQVNDRDNNCPQVSSTYDEVGNSSTTRFDKNIAEREGSQSSLISSSNCAAATESHALPHVDVFRRFQDQHRRSSVQEPLFIDVGASDTWNSGHHGPLELLYNYQTPSMEHPLSLYQTLKTTATTAVYSTHTVTTAVASSTPVYTTYNNWTQCQHNHPNIYREERMLEGEEQITDHASPRETMTDVTILSGSDVIEDALDLISQDGDYMERIGMDDVRMQCFICSWAGPKTILEYHIRIQHAHMIIRRDWPTWSATVPLTGSRRVLRAVSEWQATHYVLTAACRRGGLHAQLAIIPKKVDTSHCTTGRLTVYNKKTGEPFIWQGFVPMLDTNLDDMNGLHLELSQLDVLPSSADLRYVNGQWVAHAASKVVVGQLEPSDIEIVVHVQIIS